MKYQYSLPTGQLTLNVTNGANPADFFTVAARDNPNRAFLFVSKYLGKHLPTLPAKMRRAQQKLVEQLPVLAQPALFIGMAETATAFGYGIYELWHGKNRRQKSLYLATTRYQIAGFERLEFTEEHSHAPTIGLHLPEENVLRETFFAAKTLVLLDDELSTGKTFVNLVKTLQNKGLELEKVIMVSLTDFSNTDVIARALAPLQVEKVNLLTGLWKYEEEQSSDVSENWQTQTAKRITLPAKPDFAARTGVNHPLHFSPWLLEKWLELTMEKRNILVLGCGELMAAPFLLAEIAEKEGIKTHFCATTRSPIKIWDEIGSRLEFQDPYGEGVRNFIYNYQRHEYDGVFLISELPENEILRQTAQDLDAILFCLTE